jgi:hypothetical protein
MSKADQSQPDGGMGVPKPSPPPTPMPPGTVEAPAPPFAPGSARHPTGAPEK